MKEVVSQLREGSAEALLELFELHVAMAELGGNVQVLSAAAEAIAAEITLLADAPNLASRERLRGLANAATKASAVMAGQARGVSDLLGVIDAWGIVQPGLRVV